MKLEDLRANAAVRGILTDGSVTVVNVQWFGSEAIELTYKTSTGNVADELLYRHDESRLEIARLGLPWSFDGDGALFRLVSEARKRADDLRTRLEKRLEELKLEARISSLPPVVLGGVLVLPRGLLNHRQGIGSAPAAANDTEASAARAREIIMEVERRLGFEPVDREFEKLGYDIESLIPGSGRLRSIEVKGRISGAPTITVTRNEILYSLNKSEDYILGIVEFLDNGEHRVHYVREPFQREPDFGVTSVNYDFAELLARAEAPG